MMTSASGAAHRPYLWQVAVLSLLGIAASAYATWHHLEYQGSQGGTGAACNINELWSCDDIAASPYSELWNIPLGVWGLGFFFALFIISLILLPRKPLTRHIHTHLSALALLSLAGVLVSLLLAGLSFFVVQAFCLTCTVVYLLCLALGGCSLYAAVKGKIEVSLFSGKTAPWYGLSSSAVLLAIILAGYTQIGGSAVDQDPTEHPDHPVQNELRRQQSMLSQVLGAEVYEIPVHRSPFSGLGEDYRKGSDEASVVLVEFADFQCPACAGFAEAAEELLKTYGKRISVVFKNYPLDSSCNRSTGSIHPQACELAILARCAGSQGKFWEYHDVVFAEQSRIAEGVPAQLAAQVGLSEEIIKQCQVSPDLRAKVMEDIALGTRLALRSTPSLFINGRAYSGPHDVAALSRVLDALLSSSVEQQGVTQEPVAP